MQGTLAEDGLLLTGADVVEVVPVCHCSEVRAIQATTANLAYGFLEMMLIDVLKKTDPSSQKGVRQVVKIDVKPTNNFHAFVSSSIASIAHACP